MLLYKACWKEESKEAGAPLPHQHRSVKYLNSQAWGTVATLMWCNFPFSNTATSNLQPRATLITASDLWFALKLLIVKGSVFPFDFLCGQLHYVYNNSLYQDPDFDPNFLSQLCTSFLMWAYFTSLILIKCRGVVVFFFHVNFFSQICSFLFSPVIAVGLTALLEFWIQIRGFFPFFSLTTFLLLQS